jgi:hypothetical protein
MTHYNSKSDDGPMVVIIKHAQIKEPKGLHLKNSTIYCYEFSHHYFLKKLLLLTYHPFIGLFDLTISNAWSGTKLILDPQFKEITDFTKRLFNTHYITWISLVFY